MKKLFALSLVIALLGTGCLKAHTAITVNDDGSGTAQLIMAVKPAALFELLESFGDELGATSEDLGSAEDICEEFKSDAIEEEELSSELDVEIAPYDKDGFCGLKITFAFAEGDDVFASLAEASGDESTTAGQGTLARQEDGGWLFETAFDEESITGDADDLAAPDEITDAAFEDVEISYELTMPGEPVAGEHNADEVVGNTFMWDLDLDNAPDRLYARTSPAGSGFPILPVAIVGVLALGALGFFVLRGRKDTVAEHTIADVIPGTESI